MMSVLHVPVVYRGRIGGSPIPRRMPALPSSRRHGLNPVVENDGASAPGLMRRVFAKLLVFAGQWDAGCASVPATRRALQRVPAVRHTYRHLVLNLRQFPERLLG
jgi:hypothetical protein